jgi:hypothetical protein
LIVGILLPEGSVGDSIALALSVIAWHVCLSPHMIMRGSYLIAASWSKPYRHTEDFSVESIKQQCRGWDGSGKCACGEHLLPHWIGDNIDRASTGGSIGG